MNRIYQRKKKCCNSMIALAILLFVLPFFTFAQLDTVHWIPPLHSRDNNQVQDHYIYLSTPVTTPFIVTIKDGGGNVLASPSIDNATPFMYSIGNGQISGSPVFVPIDSLNKVLTHSGLMLTANSMFYANLRVQSASQAASLTANGTAAFGKTFRIGGFPQVLDASSRNFTAGIMARDSNTTVTIDGYNAGVLFAGVPYVSIPSITVMLNPGECYVVSGYTNTAANLSGFIGALVQSDKPIVLDNGNMLGTIANDGSQDIGIDQSVPVEKVGKNYILIEGNGSSLLETPIVIAHYNNTEIFVNGNSVPIATINAGQFYLVPNSNYQGSPDRNMHIRTSEPAYMYQALAGAGSNATGGLNFIPPYNCYLQDSIDMIPLVDQIGGTNYTGGVMVFTRQGSILKINGVVQTGAVPVLSVPWETYKILGLTGNIKIKSTSGVAAGIYGASGAAGFAGYFAGFTSFPLPSTFSYATFSDTCVSFPIDFIANYDGAPDSLIWDFGDPGSGTNDTSSFTNPSHTFSSPGNYSVRLVVFRCENDTVIKTIRAFSIPFADFSVADVCYKDSTHFTNTSSVDSATSSNATYLWNFGDGSPPDSIKNPVHYYSNPGTYITTLIVTSGCTDTTTAIVNVFDKPTSVFTFSNSCLADSAAFTNTTLNPTMGSTTGWSWDFGDGTLLNTGSWSPNHLYASSGNYQVTLITHSSNLGCADTLKDSISVFPMPLANFGFVNVCLNQAMNFSDSSMVSNGSIISYSWNFDDGTATSAVQNPSHTYTNSGTYIVSLIVRSNYGCNDTILKSVVVHPLPLAQFSSTNVCDGDSVQFTDQSNIITPDIIQTHTWNFGDGSTIGNNQNTSHLYAGASSYSVQLLVVSNFGCKDSISKISIVNPNPIVNFTANDTVGCEPLCISFQDFSFITTGGNVQWLWNVGDGSTVNNLQVFNHCYINDSVFAPISFNVILTVTSNSGCVSTLAKNNFITVYPNPNAAFTALPQITTLTDPVISVTNLSTGANFWNWNFGDLQTSIAFNPYTHSYADTGKYTISLNVSTLYNCMDSAYQTIIIEPDFMFYIPNAFTPDDDGINDNFTGKGVFIKEFEMSIFDRWGNLIFFSSDISKPWDGKANHGTEIAQRDIYIYNFKVTDFKMLKHNYKGVVTLVR